MLSEESQLKKDKHYMVSFIWIVTKGERRKNKWEISVRVTEHERLLTLGNKQGVVEGEEGGGME